MESRWMPLNEVKITNDINSIHCDTRDFYCLFLEKKLDNKVKDEKELIKLINNKKAKENTLMKQSDIVQWLQMLDDISKEG